MKYYIIVIIALLIITILSLKKCCYNKKIKSKDYYDNSVPCIPLNPKFDPEFSPDYVIDSSGRGTIRFIKAQENINGKCYCRPRFNWEDPFNNGKNLCYNDNDLTSTDEYSFPYNSNNDIYGKNSQIGNDCSSDIDCGQVKLNNGGRVDYLSNLRCNSKNKCEDISTLYY